MDRISLPEEAENCIALADEQGNTPLEAPVAQKNARPMYEERHWGDYRVLDYKQADGVSSLVKRICIEAGKAISYQYHNKRSEIWVIVSGTGVLTIEDEDSAVSPGHVVQIPLGAKHSVRAETELEFIEVQLGAGALEEEDIVRLPR